jgi:hypothetical protein
MRMLRRLDSQGGEAGQSMARHASIRNEATMRGDDRARDPHRASSSESNHAIERTCTLAALAVGCVARSPENNFANPTIFLEHHSDHN